MKPPVAPSLTDMWLDLESVVAGTAARIGEVTIGMSKPKYKGSPLAARTILCFRGPAMEALVDLGARFKVQINKSGANTLRFTRHAEGLIKATITKGHARIFIPTLTVWPDEERATEIVGWDSARDWLEVKLREDWAKPTPAKS